MAGGSGIIRDSICNNLFWHNNLDEYSITVSSNNGETINYALIANNTIYDGYYGIQTTGASVHVINNIIAEMANSYVSWHTTQDSEVVASNNCIQGHVG
ncbi:MAG: hypothetical protein SWO11_22955 [Thermodesulfobacteriota bacterium]|nr:hypothetical protein [Thermodesulfobacteriota bacterium]